MFGLSLKSNNYQNTRMVFCNDHESIQLPNTVCSKKKKNKKNKKTQPFPDTKRKRNQDTKGKVGTTIKTLQAESQKDSFFSKNGRTAIQNRNFTRTYNDRYSSKPQQEYHLRTVSKILQGTGVGEGGLNRLNVATTIALSSAVVYTRHLFSPLEGFLTQCNISENIKIKRIQR